MDSQSGLELMLDLETLGTKPGSPITEIGMVVFDAATGAVTAEFFCKLGVTEQLQLGAHIAPDTVAWWEKTNPTKLLEMSNDVTPVLPELRRLVDFCVTHDAAGCDRVWAQGQDFDFPLLGWLMARFGIETPWDFWKHRDTRTAFDVYGFDYRNAPRVGDHHNALDDCLTQVMHLTAAQQGAG